MTITSRLLRLPAIILGGLTIATVFSLLFGWIVMLLWNAVIPDIFGLPLIGYWQAVGLLILSHLLVKTGFHPNPHRPLLRRARFVHRRPPFRMPPSGLRDPREITPDSAPTAE